MAPMIKIISGNQNGQVREMSTKSNARFHAGRLADEVGSATRSGGGRTRRSTDWPRLRLAEGSHPSGSSPKSPSRERSRLSRSTIALARNSETASPLRSNLRDRSGPLDSAGRVDLDPTGFRKFVILPIVTVYGISLEESCSRKSSQAAALGRFAGIPGKDFCFS